MLCDGDRLDVGPEPELVGRREEWRRLVGVWSWMQSWETPEKEERREDRRAWPEAVCGGGGSDKSPITVANGNHTIPGRSHRVGVTSDEAENAPRLTVTYGED